MQIPTLDEMNAKLNGAAFFTTLDCQGGFHQIPIAKTSQLLLTFSTPFGRFCYQQLPFGLVSAPEVYQKIMHDLVADIDGSIYYIDLIVYGKTRDEHTAALEHVMQRLSDNGLRLNLAKCNFAKQSISFLGYTWNSSGMRPGDEKLAIVVFLWVCVFVQSINSVFADVHSFIYFLCFDGIHTIDGVTHTCNQLCFLLRCSQESILTLDDALYGSFVDCGYLA